MSQAKMEAVRAHIIKKIDRGWSKSVDKMETKLEGMFAGYKTVAKKHRQEYRAELVSALSIHVSIGLNRLNRTLAPRSIVAEPGYLVFR